MFSAPYYSLHWTWLSVVMIPVLIVGYISPSKSRISGLYSTDFITALYVWYCHMSLGTACFVPSKLLDTIYCAYVSYPCTRYMRHAPHVLFCLIISNIRCNDTTLWQRNMGNHHTRHDSPRSCRDALCKKC